MSRESPTESEIKFYEKVNEMIISRDPTEAFSGRLVRAVFPRWIKAVEDMRGVSPGDAVSEILRVTAWLLTATVIPLMKDDVDYEEAKKHLAKSFMEVYSLAYDENVNIRKEEHLK